MGLGNSSLGWVGIYMSIDGKINRGLNLFLHTNINNYTTFTM